jgi:hypothetical protein
LTVMMILRNLTGDQGDLSKLAEEADLELY